MVRNFIICDDVTPLAGVWIEIKVVGSFSKGDFTVTPLAGVWIEISNVYFFCERLPVTPLAGVWIEI